MASPMAAPPAAPRGRGAKRKRVVLTLREKMEICTRLERGESRKALTQEYNVGLSTLYDIRAHKAQLLRFVASADCGQALERRRTLHTPKLEHLDRVLYQWFLGQRAEGVPVSGPMLIEKARDLYTQMQLTEPCVFSGGWLWRFKARHGIRKLDVAGERQAANPRATEQFCGFFRSLAAEHGLSPEQVYSANETGLLWRGLPSTGTEGVAVASPRPCRDRLSVLVCANATGSHRIKPLAVSKCSSPQVARGLQQLPVACKAQGHAWVDREVFADWFHHIFAPSVREHFRALGLPADSKAVLLLERSRARPQESELVSENIFSILLPASVASLLQPMEQGIRRAFLRHFLGPPAPPSVSEAMLHVACAWNAVPSQVFQRAWRRLWPTAALAERSEEEEELRRARPHKTFAHILQLTRGSGLQDRGARGWGSAEQEVAEEGDSLWAAEKVEPAGEGNAGKNTEGAWEQAAASFATLLGFAEGQPCFSAHEVGQLRSLHAVFQKQQQLRRQPGAVIKVGALQEQSGSCKAPAHYPLPCPSAAPEN
ncbi:jerky protein homolog [Ochotona curzoniae]|uniref:jerky protein homolog n=1 Tax=Ochotona curzoniae TaxID=130825 RepID=UPI001B3473FA|nr:jerky protein homolog [Ochotona curzoniae]